MNSPIQPSSATEARPEAEPRTSCLDGWTLREYSVVTSTNLVAVKLAAWDAVRADTQTGGRGRFQRAWVSDAGGLWLSAVVPTGDNRQEWRALPMVAGLAAANTLRALGVADLRLRWPNDLMVQDRKLAGLLLDSFAPQLAVIGIGINVTNHPERLDPALTSISIRLADLISPPPLTELTRQLLASFRRVVRTMATSGFHALQPQVNTLWGQPRRVELELDHDVRQGRFAGVDGEGRLLLQDDSGATTSYDTHQVKHLKELS